MRIIEINALGNGAHRNQTSSGVLPVPDGWAVMREGVEHENFPFGNFEVEDINGVPHVKEDSWTPLPFPDPEFEPEPTDTEVLNVLLGVDE